MRALTFLSSLTTALSAVATVQALTPSPVPTFETLFVGSFIVEDVKTINQGTFGTRVHGAITGGNLTDTSGKVVAQILPTADTGILSNSGIFFPEVVLPLVWTADNKYAHLNIQGVGELFVTDMTYVYVSASMLNATMRAHTNLMTLRRHLETDSEQYSSLNSRFLLANITFPGGAQSTGNPIVTIYGLL
ncbi:hypothetical protein C8Q80DRAFT_1137914 [Daedaleopsis nitida]|nr:hypothetical protein C8Q80DRAFT_1137914 [Daedaleopsis nitida]